MKKLKIFFIIGLVLTISGFLFNRYSGEKCYIKLSDRVLILEIGKIEGWDNRFRDIKILSASGKYALFPKELVTGTIGGGMYEDSDNSCQCENLKYVRKSKNQMLIFYHFYSNDSGKSFVDFGEFTGRIKKEFNENDLWNCYADIIGDSLILKFNTVNNRNIYKIFFSTNGGKTWQKQE